MKAGVSMKTNDYVKYITQTVIKYIDQPKDDRETNPCGKKKKRKGHFYFAGLVFCHTSFWQELEKVTKKRHKACFLVTFLEFKWIFL